MEITDFESIYVMQTAFFKCHSAEYSTRPMANTLLVGGVVVYFLNVKRLYFCTISNVFHPFHFRWIFAACGRVIINLLWYEGYTPGLGPWISHLSN